MARVSRKNKTEVVEQISERIYNVAVYTRLSVEDGGVNNPESIVTQQYFVEQFVNTQKDMCIAGRYSDNGFTGINFERPDFERMMDDVRAKKIDCIVVKDLSRFSRNYVETGYFLEKIFPFLDVRFIAITDGYDTTKTTDGNDMVVSIKNIVNNIYAKDISKKLSTAFRQKQEKGHYTTGSVPYGYSKDPDDKTRLVINPETAPTVKRMFQMRLDGMGYSAIAKVLNEERVLTPNMYNYLNGKHRKKEVPESMRVWKNTPILHILENFNYTGNIEGHKREKSIAEGIADRHTDKSERIITYNTHEAIVSLEDFNKVQEINKVMSDKFKSQMGKYPKTENIFLGLMYCSDCGVKMTRVKNIYQKNPDTAQYHFICTTRKHNKYSETPCTLKHVKEADLISAILESLRFNITLSTQLSKKLSTSKMSKQIDAQNKKTQKQIDKSNRNLQNLSLRKTQVFEKYADGTLSFSEFNTIKSNYEQQCKLVETKIAELNLIKQKQDDLFTDKNRWLQNFIDRPLETVLTREILLELVEKIVVSEYNTITITWKYADELQALLQYLEVQGK